MIIGVLTGELFLPDNHSLKEKRIVLKSLLERLKKKLNVSVAEIDHQDLWQRATIAVVCVCTTKNGADKILHQAVALIDQVHELELINPMFDFC